MSGWELLITAEQSQTETTVCQLPFGKYLEDHMDKHTHTRLTALFPGLPG